MLARKVDTSFSVSLISGVVICAGDEMRGVLVKIIANCHANSQTSTKLNHWDGKELRSQAVVEAEEHLTD
jgi:hypothetical protein